MMEPDTQRIQAMAKLKSPIPKFMKHSGSIQGPADLSSRRGFSRGAGGQDRRGRHRRGRGSVQILEEIPPRGGAASRVSTGKNLTAPSLNQLHQTAQRNSRRSFGDPRFGIFRPGSAGAGA